MNLRALTWFLFGLTIALLAATASAGWTFGAACYPDRAQAMQAAAQAMPTLQEPRVYPSLTDPCEPALNGYVCFFLDASGYFAGSYRLTPCFENKPTASNPERRQEGSRESGPRSPQGLAVSGSPCCPNGAPAQLPEGQAGRPGLGYGESTPSDSPLVFRFSEPAKNLKWAVASNTAHKCQK